MTTKTRIFSSLVLTAATLVIVPPSSDDASAKGLSGARSFGVVRTSPVVISRARTVPTSVYKLSTARKLSTTSALSSQRKLSATPAAAKLKNSQTALKASRLREVEPGKGDPGKGDPGKGDSGKGDPGKGDPGKGDPGKGGTVEKEKPPVIIVERPRPIYPAVGIGAVPASAPVAVDPPGCVYERSVRKLPGGGLQRVIVKICPDA